jgi:hypothetical protein
MTFLTEIRGLSNQICQLFLLIDKTFPRKR